jgi:hypothetical protein
MTKYIIPTPFYVPDFLEQFRLTILLYCKKIRYDHEFRCIKLTKGKYAIVSLEDFDQLNRNKWSVKISGSNSYAFRMENGKAVYMHNQVAQPPPDKIVDHDDHNGLNNSRINLRLATLSQNNCNRRKKTGCSSRYKGVCRKKNDKWRARITSSKKRILLGDFDNEIDAAKAYDQAARLYHDKFAVLNFPDDPQRKFTP